MRGIDNREVLADGETKSIGAEDTFSYDLTELEEMNNELDKLAKIVHERLSRYQLQGRTITLKIKYHDFKQITRNQSFPKGVGDLQIICETAKSLLVKTDLLNKKIRLLGISLSNFNEPKIKGSTGQFELF